MKLTILMLGIVLLSGCVTYVDPVVTPRPVVVHYVRVAPHETYRRCWDRPLACRVTTNRFLPRHVPPAPRVMVPREPIRRPQVMERARPRADTPPPANRGTRPERRVRP